MRCPPNNRHHHPQQTPNDKPPSNGSTPQRTTALERALSSGALQFEAELLAWQKGGAVAQRQARTTAAEQLRTARKNRQPDLILTGLTALPRCIAQLPTLKSLSLPKCCMQAIEVLPPNLEKLIAPGIGLTRLPTLPPGLDLLDVNDNCLSRLPDIPSSVTVIRAARNRLCDLPATIAGMDNPCLIDIEHNPIPDTALARIMARLGNRSGHPFTQYLDSTAADRHGKTGSLLATTLIDPITALGDELTRWYALNATLDNPAQVDDMRWTLAPAQPDSDAGLDADAAGADNGAEELAVRFTHLLQMLRTSIAELHPAAKERQIHRVMNLIDATSVDAALQTAVLSAATKAHAANHDNPGNALNHAELAARCHQAKKARYTGNELIHIGKQIYDAELLEDCVAEATGQPEDDIPDLTRACQILLAAELGLPQPSPQMQDWAAGRITQTHLATAHRKYQALLNDHDLRVDYFLNWTPWLMHLDAVISPELAAATLALIAVQGDTHDPKLRQELELAARERMTAARRALTLAILAAAGR